MFWQCHGTELKQLLWENHNIKDTRRYSVGEYSIFNYRRYQYQPLSSPPINSQLSSVADVISWDLLILLTYSSINQASPILHFHKNCWAPYEVSFSWKRAHGRDDECIYNVTDTNTMLLDTVSDTQMKKPTHENDLRLCEESPPDTNSSIKRRHLIMSPCYHAMWNANRKYDDVSLLYVQKHFWIPYSFLELWLQRTWIHE